MAQRGSPVPASSNDAVQLGATVVGLGAALVAFVYVLGGLVMSIRLLADGFSADSVVSLSGQAPRELVISVGLLQAIGPAALVGATAAIWYGILDGPKARQRTGTTVEGDPDKLDEGPSEKLTLGLLGLLGVASVAPGAIIAWSSGDGFSFSEGLAFAVTLAVTVPLVFAGWYVKRKVARLTGYRLTRAVAAGGVWAGMALAPVVFTVGVVPLEKAKRALRVILWTAGSSPKRQTGLSSQRRNELTAILPPKASSRFLRAR
jgi:hypothetical protein